MLTPSTSFNSPWGQEADATRHCSKARAPWAATPLPNFPGSLAVVLGHVTSLGRWSIIESEMCRFKVKAVKSLCDSPSLSILSKWSSHQLKDGKRSHLGLHVWRTRDTLYGMMDFCYCSTLKTSLTNVPPSQGLMPGTTFRGTRQLIPHSAPQHQPCLP